MPNRTGRDDLAFLGAAFFAALTITYTEVVLFGALIFISHYINASLTIGIALIGTALGGITANWLARHNRLRIDVWCIATVFSLAAMLGAIFVFSSSILYGVVFLIAPFFTAATVISIAFVKLPSAKVYLVDLAGASLGVILAIPLIPIFLESGAIAMGAVFPIISLCLIYLARRKTIRFAISAAAAVLVVAGVLWSHVNDYLNVSKYAACREDKAKIFCLREKESNDSESRRAKKKPAEIIASASHLVGRVDAVKHPHKPGKTYYHGYVADTFSQATPSKFEWDLRIPNGYIKDPDTLIIGLSAQGVSKVARNLGRGQVTGVEINPETVRLMSPGGILYEESGRAYDDIIVSVMDGRTFSRNTSNKYDFVTLMNAHRGRNADYLGAPEHLTTVEAFMDYMAILKDGGMIVIEELVTKQPRSLTSQYKLIETAREALRRSGATDPMRHLFAYHWSLDARYINLLVSKTPLSDEQVSRLKTWLDKVKENGWYKKIDITYAPGDTPETPFGKNLMRQNLVSIMDKKGLDIRPATDDRPFPTHVFAWAPDALGILLVSLLLTVFFILIPAAFLLKQDKNGEKRGRFFDMMYFSCVGAGYMIVEVALIHKYQLYLGAPAYSFAAVLGTMLAASGLGGYFLRIKSPRTGFAVCAAIVLIGLIELPLLKIIFSSTQGEALGLRVALTILSVTPISLLMGAPLPNAMERLRARRGDGPVATSYAIAGGFGVIGSALAYWIAVLLGFTLALQIGLLFYLLAGLTAWKVYRSNS